MTMHAKRETVDYQQQYEAIDAPERIYSLLKPSMEDGARISIAADRTDELFHTNLVDIDYQRKSLYLKKISYTFGHLMVIDAKTLTVYSQHDGAQVSFRSYLSRYSERNGGFYEIRFPEQVKYCQRRMSYRVHISYSMGIKAELYTEGGQKIEGHLRDISTGGLRLQLPKVDTKQIKELALIKNCVIHLPAHQQINCALQIHHKHNHVRNKGCTIGGSFVEMGYDQKRDIQKFISGLQRRSLREVLV